MARTGGETAEHRELKRLALVWAQAHGFRAAAPEVALPRCGYRADVAACMIPGGSGEVAGDLAVFECKQARADCLRDTAREHETLERLRVVQERRRELETMLALHLPSLRRGESLFAECDAYALDTIRHEGWAAVRREEALLSARLYGKTKFARLTRYRCADRHYLVIEPGVLQAHEVPLGWGLLVRDGSGLRLERRPERCEVSPAARLAFLHRLLLAATRAVNTHAGVSFEMVQEVRRSTAPE